MPVSILFLYMQTCCGSVCMVALSTCFLWWATCSRYWHLPWTGAFLYHVGSLGSTEMASPSHSWHVDIDFAFVHADLQRHDGSFGDSLLIMGNALQIWASSFASHFPLTLCEPWKQRNHISKRFMARRCRFRFHVCRLAAPWLFGRLVACCG